MKTKICKHCGNSFIPNGYNKYRQQYCVSEICRKASKKASDKKYRDSKKNSEEFKKKEVKRVQEWRAENPGYSRKNKKISKVLALLHDIVLREKSQDFITLRDTVISLDTKFKGFTGVVLGALHDSMDKIEKQLYIRGQELSLGIDSKI